MATSSSTKPIAQWQCEQTDAIHEEEHAAQARTTRAAASTRGTGEHCKPTSSAVGHTASMPGGLRVGEISGGQARVRGALAELRPHFGGRSRSSSSSMFEVGLSFRAAEESQEIRQDRDLHDFPCLKALLADAMEVLSGSHDLGESSLNIICRRYTPGQGIPKHVDRKEIFCEDVYGCILRNTSDGALEFTRQQSSYMHGEDAPEEVFRIDEQPGTCFLQKGAARYEWVHGIKPITVGERCSVTWRWFSKGDDLPDNVNEQTRNPVLPSQVQRHAGRRTRGARGGYGQRT